MLKTAIIVCAMSLAATGSLHAGATIEVEKLSKADLLKTLQTASDDTVIEFQGQSKTKAQWYSEFQATQKRALEKQKEAAAAAQASFDAARKALQDQQDAANAKQNAETEKEFETLSSQ
jgi:lysyl-tRNA synthetase class I